MGVPSNCCGGFVDPERMYKVEILCEILRIKESTINAAVRKGLEVITIHKARYVMGKEWIRYVCAKGKRRGPGSESWQGNNPVS